MTDYLNKKEWNMIKLRLKTNATLKSMDFHMDARKTAEYKNESFLAFAERLTQLDAKFSIDRDDIIAYRENGRGFIQASKKLVKGVCGCYGEVKVL